jgi:MarR family transcriptional regulator, 2-MHQ and catechol-resistance regulon repressor
VAPRKLQHEIGKRQPFVSLEEEATLSLLRTSDQMQIHFTRLFREYGLTSSQYNVLRILRGEGKPLPILEIAERTVTVVPGITGLIDRLEQAGMVRRQRCPEDRRVIFVAISEQALKLLDRLDDPTRDLQRRTLSHLTRVELKTMIRLLEKVRESASEKSS